MNRNIAKIIAFLRARKESRHLCFVGQQRLRWWVREGRKFRSVKAALSTWTAQEIKDWFDYAGIDQDIAGRSAKERYAYWAAVEFLETTDDSGKMPPHLEKACLVLVKKVQKWKEKVAKATLLNQSERDLIGKAGDAPDSW